MSLIGLTVSTERCMDEPGPNTNPVLCVREATQAGYICLGMYHRRHRQADMVADIRLAVVSSARLNRVPSTITTTSGG